MELNTWYSIYYQYSRRTVVENIPGKYLGQEKLGDVHFCKFRDTEGEIFLVQTKKISLINTSNYTEE